jgi:hypothetical protein
MNDIARHFSTAAIVASSSANSVAPRVAFGPFASGVVLVANTGGCTQINWHGAASAEGTPLPLQASGAAVTSAIVVGAIPFPDQTFALPFVVPVVVGATSCSMTVCLKG